MRLGVVPSAWWRGIFVMALAITLALALMPLRLQDGGWEHGDKLLHATTFAVLATVAWLGWPQRHRAIAAGLAFYGIAIEVLQGMTPTRHASVADFVADGVGIALGLWLARRWLVVRAG